MKTTIMIGATAILFMTPPTVAQTADQPPAATPVEGAPAASGGEVASPFASAKPLGEGRLGAIAGRADVAQVVNAQNRAVVTNNRVDGVSTTGDISFDASSFSGLNGLALISANSGNNVAINASLNVNVAIRP